MSTKVTANDVWFEKYPYHGGSLEILRELGEVKSQNLYIGGGGGSGAQTNKTCGMGMDIHSLRGRRTKGREGGS